MPGCAASERRLRSTNRPKLGRAASGKRVAIERTRSGAVISNSRSVRAGPVEALFCLIARRKERPFPKRRANGDQRVLMRRTADNPQGSSEERRVREEWGKKGRIR